VKLLKSFLHTISPECTPAVLCAVQRVTGFRGSVTKPREL